MRTRERRVQFAPKKTGKREYGVAVRGFREPLTLGSNPEHLGLLTAIASTAGPRAAKAEVQALCDLLNKAQDAFYAGVRDADIVERRFDLQKMEQD